MSEHRLLIIWLSIDGAVVIFLNYLSTFFCYKIAKKGLQRAETTDLSLFPTEGMAYRASRLALFFKQSFYWAGSLASLLILYVFKVLIAPLLALFAGLVTMRLAGATIVGALTRRPRRPTEQVRISWKWLLDCHMARLGLQMQLIEAYSRNAWPNQQ